MRHKVKGSEQFSEMRRQVEALLMERIAQSPSAIAFWPAEEALRSLRELSAHEIELEMQNEKLKGALSEVEPGRERFLDLYDYAQMGYVLLSEQGLILKVNLATAGMVEDIRGELVNQPFTRFVLLEDQDLYYRHHSQLFETGEQQVWDQRMVQKDGTPFWVHIQAGLTQDAGGPPMAKLVISDISERKEAEDVLLETTQRLQLATTAASMGVWDWNIPSGSLVWDDRMLELYGITREEFKGTEESWKENLHPEDMERAIGELEKTLRCGAPYNTEFRVKHKNGAIRWIKSDAVVLQDENGNLVRMTGLNQDITERKLQEEERQKSLERFTTMVNYCFDWEFWISPHSEFIFNSPSCERVTGYGIDDFGNDVDLIKKIVHPDDREIFNKHLENANGADGGSCCQSLDFRIITRDGRERWLFHTCQNVFDRNGNSLGRRASHVDITDRKVAETNLLNLNAELEQRVKERTTQLEAANKEMEAFSYSVSHDLRAPLRSIDGFSQVLLEDYGDSLDEEGKHYLTRIRSGAQRMGILIDDLLTLSKTSHSELTKVVCDLSMLSSRVMGDLADLNAERTVEVSIQPGMLVQADHHLMQVVLENLLGNAWKYTSKTEHPRVEVGEITSPEGERTFFIRDNGAGFDMAHAGKLFNAFQRLHAATDFEGTGIGLAIVQRIIHRHGGRIWAEGEPGKGATFFFTIPEPSQPALL